MRKILAPFAALALVLSMAGIALAWVEPTLSALCAPDTDHYAWRIHLADDEDDYNIDWSFDSDFDTFTTVDFVTSGNHDFLTPRTGPILYVRWSSDHDSDAQANADPALCQEPSVEQSVAESAPASPEESFLAGTGTPDASVPNTSLDGNGSSPLPTIIFSVVLLTSLGALAYTNVKVARAPRRIR